MWKIESKNKIWISFLSGNKTWNWIQNFSRERIHILILFQNQEVIRNRKTSFRPVGQKCTIRAKWIELTTEDKSLCYSVATVRVGTGFGPNWTIFLTRPDQTNINRSKKSRSVYASAINGYEQFEPQLISILGWINEHSLDRSKPARDLSMTSIDH